jgi:hypothetical protein
MTNQTLARTTVRILRQPFVQKIAYDLHGLTVTGLRYAMVAKAVEEGKIECVIESTIKPKYDGEVAPDTIIEAQYRAAQNAMVFKSENYGMYSGIEERTIFHEATHAIFDLFAKSKDDRTLGIEDESAAVLAEAHYVRLSPKPAGNFAMWIDGPQDNALKLVDKMMADTGDFERDRRTYFLQPQQTLALRNAVAQDWHFVKYTDSKGYQTDASGVQYIYDGVVQCYACWAQGT